MRAEQRFMHIADAQVQQASFREKPWLENILLDVSLIWLEKVRVVALSRINLCDGSNSKARLSQATVMKSTMTLLLRASIRLATSNVSAPKHNPDPQETCPPHLQ